MPLVCTTVLPAESLIVDSCGASSGSLSQAPAKIAAQATHNRRFRDCLSPVMMEIILTEMSTEMSNYNSPMNLETKSSARLPAGHLTRHGGYAMAALLVAMAIMAIILSAAMPTWSHMIRRE